jgi:hypothetical protein
MKIKKYCKSFIVYSKSEDYPILNVLPKLEGIVRKETEGKDFDVFVRDFSGNQFFDRGCCNAVDISLMFEYKDGKEQDVSGLYSDIHSINLSKFDRLDERLDFTNSQRVYEPNAMFMLTEHKLWYPFHLNFCENYKDIAVQKNELIVSATAELYKKTIKSIKRVCKTEGCDVAVYTSTKDQNSKPATFFMYDDKSSTSGMPAPEIKVVVSWDGPDFDNKAICLYGKIQELLVEEHKKTIAKYISHIIERPYQHKEIVINQERDKSYSIDDITCHMFCRVPFQYKDKRLVGDISYYHFKGR